MKPKEITIIYDGECPVCKSYTQKIRLDTTFSTVKLLNARNINRSTRNELADKGFNLNEGMVVKIEENWFYGAEAINILSLLSTPLGVFNKINSIFFRYPITCKIAYPLMRSGRNLLLKLKGIPKIPDQ